MTNVHRAFAVSAEARIHYSGNKPVLCSCVELLMSRDTTIGYGITTGTSSGASGMTPGLDSIDFALNIVGENT